jgi:hypothetical protein
MSNKVEEPSYVVLNSLENNVEIREYQSQIWAVTSKRSENEAFRILAGYIFGDNDKKEKIGMTAPVLTTNESMAFVMPRRYDTENLPKPLIDQIEIESVGPRTMAVIRFSGFSGPEKDERYLNLLLDTLKKHGMETDGEAYVMRYNPPWTPPFMRRNEVAIELKKKS